MAAGKTRAISCMIKHMRGWRSATCLLLAVLAAEPAWNQMGIEAPFFQRGRSRLTINGAYARSNNNDYLVLGLGAGYYVMDGLELGAGAEAWLGSVPHIYKVSPEATYVLETPQFKPYFGGFYRHTFYDRLPSLDSAGGRAGFILPVSPRTYASAGLVYELLFRCDSGRYGRCSQVYPEASFSVSF